MTPGIIGAMVDKGAIIVFHMHQGERAMSADQNEKRTRVVTWTHPSKSARNSQEISGFDYLCAVRDGKREPPPVAKLLGYRIASVSKGQAVFELLPAEYLYNPFSTVHGGILMTLLDTAMTAAVMTLLSKGEACSTLEMKSNLLRPVTDKIGLIRAQGNVLHMGHRTATCEGKIMGSQGSPMAAALGTSMIMRA